MHVNFRRELGRDPWFISGVILIVIIAAAAFIGPATAPHDPYDMSFNPLDPPSKDHYLGVNDGGMDIFSELLFGLRNTVMFGLFTSAAASVVGIGLGLISAWFGGMTDRVLMRLADIIMSIPAIMVLILTAAFFRPSPIVLALILAMLSWPAPARAYRSQALILRQSLHVRATVQMGAGSCYIIIRHLIPELFPLYLTGFAAKARMAMIMEASLAFLGLFDPGRKSLGAMISYALKYYYMDVWWNWLMPPILCLSLLIMSFTFLAIGMEKMFDPRLRDAL